MTVTAPTAAGTAGPAVMGKVKRHILPLVLLLYIFNYMDRANIGYAQLGMSTELGIDIGTYGTVAAIFFVAYVVFEIPSNMVMKSVGARIWLARIAVSWGIVAVLTACVQNTGELFAARILLGVAEAGLFPGLLLYLTYWFKTAERGRAMATMSLAQPIALIIGSITGGLIIDHVGWFGLSSWRWVFILQGIPPILVGLWVLLRLPDKPQKASWLEPAEQDWLENEIASEYAPEHDHSLEAQLAALKDWRIFYLAIINLLYAVGLYGMTFFLPEVIAQIHPGYSSTNIGFIGAVPYVVAAVAMVVTSRYSDRTGNRKSLVMGLLTTSCVGLIGTMAFRHDSVPAVIFLCLLAIGVLSYLGPFWSMASESLTRHQMAVGLAVINSIAAAGGFFGPFIIGKTSAKDNVTVGLVFPLVCLAVAVVLLAFWKVNRTAEPTTHRATATPRAAVQH